MTQTLNLFNSLTRRIEPFVPVHPGEARVYTCGPTVYNHQHIGNMRAYVFADTLGRALTARGLKLTHVINITDVGHLTSDADAGEDKMERAAATTGRSAWDIARFYTAAYREDVRRLNIREPAHWSIATDYVPAMIDYAKGIAGKHCYRLDDGLYFDTSSVPDYGRLARAETEDGQTRIGAVAGKRNAADFAIWRTTPPCETRQMEWDSPWGRGAPGWHLECSVMSAALLGLPFDIHTGGIDHREIHHPNEIAQNQAHACSPDSGARIWMHNNFLVDRETGKMSKSTGNFLTLQALVDRGFHPLAYRVMCLQAHYRSELEFSWDNLRAAFVRLKRLVLAYDAVLGGDEHRGDMSPALAEKVAEFDDAIGDDLNTAAALVVLERTLGLKKVDGAQKARVATPMLAGLGLDFDLLGIDREALRLRPAGAILDVAHIEARLDERRQARADKDFATSDRIRDELAASGVEVMDGDPLGWDWRV